MQAQDGQAKRAPSVKLTPMKSQPGLLANVAKRLRGFASRFKEKPQATLEDVELEHFMLYHGLVGSSPENQRAFRTVRADIQEAVERASVEEIAIALKVPPLWWDDKLVAIFSEFPSTAREKILDLICPSRTKSELDPAVDPLMHENWHTRANAARMLAWYDCRECVPHIVTAMNDTASSARAAFCHFAISLGKMPTAEGRSALVPYLLHDEPWFQVDAAAALSAWPLAEVADDLLGAMLHNHHYGDYMSIVIARQHKLGDLLSSQLKSGNSRQMDGALEVLMGVLDASERTFTVDLAYDLGAASTLPVVLDAAEQQTTPRRMYSCLRLSRWLATNARTGTVAPKHNDLLDSWGKAKVTQTIRQWLAKANDTDPDSAGQVRHAIRICALEEIAVPESELVNLVRPDFHSLVTLLDTLHARLVPGASAKIVALIEDLVDMEARTTGDAQQHAVFEDDPQKALVYWHALKALGTNPDDIALELLLKATSDFAADKRQRALESLIAAAASADSKSKLQAAPLADQLQAAIARALADPAHQVRIAALQAVATFAATASLPEAVKLATSREASVRTACAQALGQLSRAGHNQAVSEALATRISKENDSYNRERLQDLINSIR